MSIEITWTELKMILALLLKNPLSISIAKMVYIVRTDIKNMYAVVLINYFIL